MASTAGSSGSSLPTTTTNEVRRPQADPLPAKVPRLVGEIGYEEYHQEADLAEVNLNDNSSMENLTPAEADARNGRHPADRSYVDLPTQSQPRPQPHSETPPSQPSDPAARSQSPASDTASMNMPVKPPKARSCLKYKINGVTVKAILFLTLFSSLVAGLIVGWVFAGLHSSQIGGSQEQQNMSVSPIFLHLIFAVLVLVSLVFLERSIFRVRAERYAHKHPGEMLPSHRHNRRPMDPDNLAYAPWNRPSLPTYAAALGFRGTGDVEDELIAGPAPPAYGNTRGSTLLLANLVRNSLASQRSRQSIRTVDRDDSSYRSGADLDRRGSTRSTNSQPIPYEEAEHQEYVRRAQRLAETLTQLEEGRESRV